MNVDLSDTECRIARYVGKLRNTLSTETKQNMRRDPQQDDQTMNIEAMGAELAVAKFLNVYPDLSPTKGSLPRYDLTWQDHQVQVKRNHLLNGDLLIPKLESDLFYVLACGSLPRYTIIGYLEGYMVRIVGEWATLRYGPCWKVRPHFLGKFKRKEWTSEVHR